MSCRAFNRKLCFRHRSISGLTQEALCTSLPIKGNSEGMERSGMEEELPGACIIKVAISIAYLLYHSDFLGYEIQGHSIHYNGHIHELTIPGSIYTHVVSEE